MNAFWTEYGSRIRWVLVGCLVLIAINYAITDMGFIGYVQSWGGTAFKVLNGAVIGWFLFRYVIGVNPAKQPTEYRAVYRVAQAILIGLCAHALATGA